MKTTVPLFILALAVSLFAATGCKSVAASEERGSLQEKLVGIWQFPVDGYYLGFDEEGQLCYGGSEESVAAKRWCNRYTLAGSIVTETCIGGPEDRNCPLGGGVCKAQVRINEAGQLQYRILPDECNMLPYRVVPPSQYVFTRK
jgi:hypothetical protein